MAQQPAEQPPYVPFGAYDTTLPSSIPAPLLTSQLPPEMLPIKEDLPLRSENKTPSSSGVGGFTLEGLLTRQECEDLIAWGEQVGIDEMPTERTDVRSNTRLRFLSPQLAKDLWPRITPHLEASIVLPCAADDADWDTWFGRGHHVAQDGVWRPVGLNPLFRLCRYEPDAHFAPHYDAQYIPAGKTEEVSFQTAMLYLNDVDGGGATNFVDPSLSLHRENGVFCASDDSIYLSLPACAGRGIVFKHKILHEGAVVKQGLKYILRTDVMYARDEGSAAEMSEKEARGRKAYADAIAAEARGETDVAQAKYRTAFKLVPELGYGDRYGA